MRGPWIVQRWRYRRRWLWVTPTLVVAGAVLLAWVMPYVDMGISDFERVEQSPLVRHFDTGAFASLLGSVASGMIAFTGFVFTAVTLALQFGTGTFSARLIPSFQRDRVIRAAMGTFLATFVYALLITVRLGARVEDYKPFLSSLVAVVLTLASVAVFIALVQRIVEMLRVVRLLRWVARMGGRAITRTYPEPYDAVPRGAEPVTGETAEPDLLIRHKGRSGPIIAVNRARMVALAARWNVRLVMIPAVGDFVTRGNPVIEVRGHLPRAGVKGLRHCFIIREERVLEYDPAFALRVLSDVANKALSPGINDPTTAVQALDYIEELLIRIGYRYLGAAGADRDAAGVVRLRYRTPAWEDFVALGVDEIRHYGATSVQVVRRLRALLDDVAKATPAVRHPALEARRAALDAAVDASFGTTLDRALARIPDGQGIGSAGRSLRQ